MPRGRVARSEMARMASAPFEPTLGAVMRSPLLSLPAETSAHDALQFLARAGVHHLPLFRGEDLMGLVCTCDLEEIPLDAPASSALRRAPVTLTVTASIAEAGRRMSEELVGSVLVLRDGRPVGIVTREDVTSLGTPSLESFHCDTCGATRHLKRFAGGVLCADCRANAEPATLDEELGGGD